MMLGSLTLPCIKNTTSFNGWIASYNADGGSNWLHNKITSSPYLNAGAFTNNGWSAAITFQLISSNVYNGTQCYGGGLTCDGCALFSSTPVNEIGISFFARHDTSYGGGLYCYIPVTT
jgi:hypothetical protein